MPPVSDADKTRRQLTAQVVIGMFSIAVVLVLLRIPWPVAALYGVVAAVLMVARAWFVQRFTPSGPAVYAHVLIAGHPLEVREALRKDSRLLDIWRERAPAVDELTNAADARALAAGARLHARGPRVRRMAAATAVLIDAVSFIAGALLGAWLPAVGGVESVFGSLCSASSLSGESWASALAASLRGPLGVLLGAAVLFRLIAYLAERWQYRRLRATARDSMREQLWTLEEEGRSERRAAVGERLQALGAWCVLREELATAIIDSFEAPSASTRWDRFTLSPQTEFSLQLVSFALGLLAGLALPPLLHWGACA